MTEFLTNVTPIAMLAFLLAGMLELGLGLSPAELLAPLRNVRIVVLALAANFLIAPALALGLARLLRLEAPFGHGLVLLGLAPGAPFIPKVVQLARGNLPLAAGLMVLLMVGTVVVLPVALPWFIAGATVSPWPVARPLVLFMLAPLLAGMAIRARIPSLPPGLRPSLSRVANLSGLLVVALILVLNYKAVLELFGTGAIFAALLFSALTALAGWLLALGADPTIAATVGLSTGARNVAAALLVAAQNFKDPRVSVMVTVAALTTLLVLLPTAVARGRRSANPTLTSSNLLP